MFKKKDKLSSDELDFQPEALEIKKRPIAKKVRWVLYLIIIFIVSLVFWAYISKIDKVVVASGKIITTAPKISIQPLRTSIIKEIHVKSGDKVRKGDLLVTLDPTFAGADLTQLNKKSMSVNVQLRRIDAELQEAEFKPKSEESEEGVLQLRVFNQRHKEFIEREKLNTDKQASLLAKLQKVKKEKKGLGIQAKLLRDMEGITARTPQTGDEGKLKLLSIQKDRYRNSSGVERLAAEEVVLGNQLKQIETEWLVFVEERRRKLLEQQVKLLNEKTRLVEDINKAMRLKELVKLKAPNNGIVLEIEERVAGSVISEARTLMTLVPLDVPLEAEVEIKAMDIGKIRLGDVCRLKLGAFPFQKHGSLKGNITIISEDAFFKKADSKEESTNQGGSFYKTRISIDESYRLKKVPEDFRLIPGMNIVAEVKVDERRVLDYFLYPVLRILDESIRE